MHRDNYLSYFCERCKARILFVIPFSAGHRNIHEGEESRRKSTASLHYTTQRPDGRGHLALPRVAEHYDVPLARHRCYVGALSRCHESGRRTWIAAAVAAAVIAFTAAHVDTACGCLPPRYSRRPMAPRTRPSTADLQR